MPAFGVALGIVESLKAVKEYVDHISPERRKDKWDGVTNESRKVILQDITPTTPPHLVDEYRNQLAMYDKSGDQLNHPENKGIKGFGRRLRIGFQISKNGRSAWRKGVATSSVLRDLKMECMLDHDSYRDKTTGECAFCVSRRNSALQTLRPGTEAPKSTEDVAHAVGGKGTETSVSDVPLTASPSASEVDLTLRSKAPQCLAVAAQVQNSGAPKVSFDQNVDLDDKLSKCPIQVDVPSGGSTFPISTSHGPIEITVKTEAALCLQISAVRPTLTPMSTTTSDTLVNSEGGAEGSSPGASSDKPELPQ